MGERRCNALPLRGDHRDILRIFQRVLGVWVRRCQDRDLRLRCQISGSPQVDRRFNGIVGEVDHLDDDFIAFLRASRNRMERLRRIPEIMDQYAVQIAPDMVARQFDTDIVPAITLDFAGDGGRYHTLTAIFAFFNGMAGIVPASDVPPVPVFIVFTAKQDQKSFGSPLLPRF